MQKQLTLMKLTLNWKVFSWISSVSNIVISNNNITNSITNNITNSIRVRGATRMSLLD